jgi:hypothetical protein
VTAPHPDAGCIELLFEGRYVVGPGAEVALEDYARALTRASGAEVLHDEGTPPRVRGLHLCAPATPPDPPVHRDLEAFARRLDEDLLPGLGWS